MGKNTVLAKTFPGFLLYFEEEKKYIEIRKFKSYLFLRMSKPTGSFAGRVYIIC